MKRLLCVVGLSMLVAATAEAQPSFWDRVKTPRASVAEETLELALRARMPREMAFDDDPALQRLYAVRSAALVELAGGEALPSSELLYFLGDTLVAAEMERDEDGRRMLRLALTLEPESPLAASAWFNVAIASNRLRDYRTERVAYGQALQLEWNADARARIYMNRGEASMSLGHLDAAMRDYRRALGASEDSEVYALANWGLAVALARANDLPRAFERVRDATKIEFRARHRRRERIKAIDLPTVFFTPEHEIHYYRAIAEMADAEHAERESDAVTNLERAVVAWRTYLTGANANGDRWIESAELYLAWCGDRLRSARAELKRPGAARRRRAGSD